MKKIIGVLIALLSAAAFGATTIPIQLITPIAANTVMMNGTGSTATPTAFAMPSCSAAGGTLQWTSGTGFTCVANAFASPPAAGYGSTTPEPVAATTISATGLISPTSTIGIKGTTTNDNAQAGSVGEYLTASLAFGSATSLTTATPKDVTSLPLTAGDYDCRGQVGLTASVGMSTVIAWINTTSATQPVASNGFGDTTLSATSSILAGQILPIMTTRISLASSGTVFLSTQTTFASGTSTAYGFVGCRRVR